MTSRSYAIVKRHLTSFDSRLFELGIKKSSGATIIREVDCTAILKSAGWLARENSRGAAIYIRPKAPSGFVLLDDLTVTALDRLSAAGLVASSIVETSPGNHQAWLCLESGPIPPALATKTAQILAKEFNADMNSADYRHFGRLAGFTNRKPQYCDGAGMFPFVLLHSSKHALIDSRIANKWLDLAMKSIENRSKELLAAVDIASIYDGANTEDAQDFYLEALRRLQRVYGSALRRNGGSYDPSIGDWMIANAMKHKGFDMKSVADAIFACSPELMERKGSNASKYISGTLNKIFN